jgi:GTP cyclohydrolase II
MDHRDGAPDMGIPKPSIEELLRHSQDHRCDGQEDCVTISAVAELPTRYGPFQVVSFHGSSGEIDHAALVRGDVRGKENVPVRLHSECLTGEAFGSLRCDCRDQLELSLRELDRRDFGVLLYLRQEGRGIGFENKIRAYQLQDAGLDTVEANEALGFQADERDYRVAAHMLRSLEIGSIVLMSNNPAKIRDLRSHGIHVAGRIPLAIPPNAFDARYLETKRIKGGHLLPPVELDLLDEQVDGLHCRDVSDTPPS